MEASHDLVSKEVLEYRKMEEERESNSKSLIESEPLVENKLLQVWRCSHLVKSEAESDQEWTVGKGSKRVRREAKGQRSEEFVRVVLRILAAEEAEADRLGDLQG